MTSALATSLFQRDLNLALSSGSLSPSANASPSPRPGSRSRHYAGITARDSYFSEVQYDSPPDGEDNDLMLRRIPRRRSADHGDDWDSPEIWITRDESYSSVPSVCRSPSASSFSSTFTSYDPSSLIYDRIIDTLTSSKPNPFTFTGARNLFMFDPSKDDSLKGENVKPLMIKRLKSTSAEVQLLYATHTPPLRDDPWNAVPHIAGVVERGDSVYFCMEQLSEYNDPPLITVEHYVDFFCQVLERLTFLHEHGISGLSLADPSSYMVDTSSGPATPTDGAPSEKFNRFKYPVHYYFVNFTKATRLPRQSLYTSSSQLSPLFDKPNAFAQDVKDCGVMFARLMENVPQLAAKFSPLLEDMSQGHFTLKRFENLLSSMDRPLFETRAIKPPLSPERRSSEANLGMDKKVDDIIERPVSH